MNFRKLNSNQYFSYFFVHAKDKKRSIGLTHKNQLCEISESPTFVFTPIYLYLCRIIIKTIKNICSEVILAVS